MVEWVGCSLGGEFGVSISIWGVRWDIVLMLSSLMANAIYLGKGCRDGKGCSFELLYS